MWSRARPNPAFVVDASVGGRVSVQRARQRVCAVAPAVASAAAAAATATATTSTSTARTARVAVATSVAPCTVASFTRRRCRDDARDYALPPARDAAKSTATAPSARRSRFSSSSSVPLRARSDGPAAPAPNDNDAAAAAGAGAAAANHASALEAPSGTVLVLGGDGFCGWPTSLHLSSLGYDVVIVDNMSRRKIDVELECESLTPIQSMQRRLAAWNSLAAQSAGDGREIRFEYVDVASEYWHLLDLIRRERPRAVVHFAEQRAAPYSMKSSRHKRYTVDNNTNGTNNVLTAIVESELDIHLVHLGTMGVYGYGNSGGQIPEGYIDVTMPSGERKTIPHPFFPGSVYHATKCLDAVLFSFFNRNDALRITDLHQGIVWGTNTPATLRDERLINRFDYDSDYGTVLNRFLMQAACDEPLTVYGTGGQTRAFIHISDTARCIALALANPPQAGERVQVFNQVAESHRVRDLAEIVARKANGRVEYISNPRNEAAENTLDVSNVNFRSIGYEPITLEASLLDEVVTVAERYKARMDRAKIMPSSFWNRKRRDACSSGSGGDDGDEAETRAAAEIPRDISELLVMTADDGDEDGAGADGASGARGDDGRIDYSSKRDQLLLALAGGDARTAQRLKDVIADADHEHGDGGGDGGGRSADGVGDGRSATRAD